MPSHRLYSVRCCLLLLLGLSSTVRAADHFLTIGGGNNAGNNQVSLEKNVLFLERYLAAAGLGAAPHEVLFSDGSAGERDIEFDDPKAEPPKVNQLLARVFNHEQGLYSQYRVHAIPQLWGAANRASIGKWFDTIGTKIPDGDRLLIYFTGHGGHGNPARNTNFALWHESSMSVNEFGGLLDRLHPKVTVVLVMVQCFSGGFADVIYNNTDPAKGLSSRPRCGFFATTFDRTAAGCTPDIDEDDYHDYSTSFWAALHGQTRTGKTVPNPDYDGNGRVSLAEAHAYALISSDTVDISNKTSDEFLRRFSSLDRKGRGGLITADVDYDQLLKLAEPADRAVLTGLAEHLHMESPNRVQSARVMATGIELRRKFLGTRKERLVKDHDALRPVLQTLLRNRWPELDNLFNPQATRLIQSEGEQMIRLVESAPQYVPFHKQEEDLDKVENESLDLERKWVKCQRFIRTAENVALAANLPSLATPEMQQRYHQLLGAENTQFGEAPKR